MIRLLCPLNEKHLIAKVDIREDGSIIPRGIHHGLSFDYAPSEDITRVRARCPKSRCTYDGSTDYGVLRDALLAAEAAQDRPGHAVDYTLTS